MRSRSLHAFFPILIFVIIIMLSSTLSACSISPNPPIVITPPPTRPPIQSLITWPFNPTNGQWDLINGYREGDHNGYATWAVDFAKCLPNSVNTSNRTCNNPNGSGWDKTHTLGADVYAPVSGTIVWGDNDCLGPSIEIDGHPGYRIVLFHIDLDPQLGKKWTDLADNHVHVQQHKTHLGKVSAGFCMPKTTGYHIHMALYHCTTNCINDLYEQRVGDPFTNPWSIDNCQYPDDGTKLNEYQGDLVPCQPNTTASPTPTSPATTIPVPVPTPTQPPTPTATPTATPSPTPTPTPTQPPTPTPTDTPTPVPVTLSSGTWNDPYGGASYGTGEPVTIVLSVNGSQVTGTMKGDFSGDTTPITGQTGPLSSFSQQDQGFLDYVVQNYGSGTGVFLVYQNTQDFIGAFAGSTYYMVLQSNGTLQGFWYFPNQQIETGALTFNRIS